MVKEIRTNRPDKVALVDDHRYPQLSQYHWTYLHCRGREYAVRTENGRTVSMHHMVLAPVTGLFVDHRDNNGLNNTEGNLRHATRAQNFANRERQRKTLSGYTGVERTRGGRWRASISSERKRHRLGTFDTPEEAAEAYRAAAIRLYGDFANIPEVEDQKGSR